MTSVRSSVAEKDEASIVAPSREMSAAEGDIRLREEFDRLQQTGSTRVVLNLSQVPYFDSSVLGQLVYGHAILTKTGGRVKLASPSERITTECSLTRLIAVFDVYRSRKDALAVWADTMNSGEEPKL